MNQTHSALQDAISKVVLEGLASLSDSARRGVLRTVESGNGRLTVTVSLAPYTLVCDLVRTAGAQRLELFRFVSDGAITFSEESAAARLN